ncbi:MAG: P-loop NTPase fold protein [Pseudomonadota bacterium]
MDYFLDEPLQADADEARKVFRYAKSLRAKFAEIPPAHGELPDASENVAQTAVVRPELRGPLTCAVYGNWGSGKTTLLSSLRRAFSDSGCLTVWFEPWRYETEDQLLVPLLIEIQSELQNSIRNESLKKAAVNTTYKLLGNAARGTLRAVSGMVEKSVGINPYEIGEEFYKQYTDMDQNYENRLSEVQQFKADLRHLIDLAGAKSAHGEISRKRTEREIKTNPERMPLVIFVDDLDRCNPERVRQLIESVKLFLHEPGIFFFMALDELQVLRAMAEPFRSYFSDQDDVNDRANAQAKQYLEKFFQYSIDLNTTAVKDSIGAMQLKQQVLKALRGALPVPDHEGLELLFVQIKDNPRAIKAVARWIHLHSPDFTLVDLAVVIFEYNWVEVYTTEIQGMSQQSRRAYFGSLYNVLLKVGFDGYGWTSSMALRILWLNDYTDEDEGTIETEGLDASSVRHLSRFFGMVRLLTSLNDRGDAEELRRLQVIAAYAVDNPPATVSAIPDTRVQIYGGSG